jgi:hypothetical protein
MCGMSAEIEGCNHSKISATTTAARPEQIWLAFLIARNMSAVSGDKADGKYTITG